jgi:hypothetical protein
MSKLRSEFDAGKCNHHLDVTFTEIFLGADWDLVPLSPADLDPHSVAGIFKAYFRECQPHLFPLCSSILMTL